MDQTLTCAECRTPFVWTTGEQAFYAERGFTAPKRCRPCREARARRTDQQSHHSRTLPGYRPR